MCWGNVKKQKRILFITITSASDAILACCTTTYSFMHHATPKRAYGQKRSERFTRDCLWGPGVNVLSVTMSLSDTKWCHGSCTDVFMPLGSLKQNTGTHGMQNTCTSWVCSQTSSQSVPLWMHGSSCKSNTKSILSAHNQLHLSSHLCLPTCVQITN